MVELLERDLKITGWYLKGCSRKGEQHVKPGGKLPPSNDYFREKMKMLPKNHSRNKECVQLADHQLNKPGWGVAGEAVNLETGQQALPKPKHKGRKEGRRTETKQSYQNHGCNICAGWKKRSR